MLNMYYKDAAILMTDKAEGANVCKYARFLKKVNCDVAHDVYVTVYSFKNTHAHVCFLHMIHISPREYLHPCKCAVMGQYRTSTGPMLPSSDQYWPGTGPVLACLQGYSRRVRGDV